MTKLRNVLALGGVAALAVLALGWFLLVSPQRSTAAGYHRKADAERAGTAGLQAQLATLKSQAQNLPAQRARLDEIDRRLPSTPAEPTLLRSLTKAAADSGVDLNTVTPANPTLVTGAGATGSAAAAAHPGAPSAGSVGQLASIQVTLNVSGTYSHIEQFEHELEELQRSWRTTTLSLAPGDGPLVAARAKASGAAKQASAAGYSGQLTASISGVVYMTSGATPAPATTSTAPAAPAHR